MFKELIKYCSKNNVFDNYDSALKAFNKHCQRQELKNCVDPLKEFYLNYHKTVQSYFRKKRQYRACKFYTYDFNDVKYFLCKNHFYGMQVFDCRSSDPTECVYFKDGVGIYYSGEYEYIEVIGLRPCDFYILKKAYERVNSYLFEED